MDDLRLIRMSELEELFEQTFEKLRVWQTNQPVQTEAPKEMLSADEVCSLICISKATLYSWTSKRLIPHFKVKGVLVFRRSEILEWIESYRVSS